MLYQQVRLEFTSLMDLDILAKIGIDPHCKLSEALYPLTAASKECEKYAEKCDHGTTSSQDSSPR